MFIHGPARVLFADDDPVLCAMAEEKLADAGYHVTVAVDGFDAWRRLEQDLFHIVLLDLSMPRMDGFDVLTRMRQSPIHRERPVIVVTGRDDIFAIDEAYERGATSFVIKPLNWPVFTRQVRFVLRASELERKVQTARSILGCDDPQLV